MRSWSATRHARRLLRHATADSAALLFGRLWGPVSRDTAPASDDRRVHTCGVHPPAQRDSVATSRCTSRSPVTSHQLHMIMNVTQLRGYPLRVNGTALYNLKRQSSAQDFYKNQNQKLREKRPATVVGRGPKGWVCTGTHTGHTGRDGCSKMCAFTPTQS